MPSVSDQGVVRLVQHGELAVSNRYHGGRPEWNAFQDTVPHHLFFFRVPPKIDQTSQDEWMRGWVDGCRAVQQRENAYSSSTYLALLSALPKTEQVSLDTNA